MINTAKATSVPSKFNSFADFPQKSGKAKITPVEMQSLREKGKTYQEIGDIAGISRQAVHQILNKNIARYSE